MICGKPLNKRHMIRHTRKCAEENAQVLGNKDEVFYLIAEGSLLPMYWILVSIPSRMTLEDLDAFLRDIWLECCRHPSFFTIDRIRYSGDPATADPGIIRTESMNKQLKTVLKPGMKFRYDFDPVAPTKLRFRIMDLLEKIPVAPGITLLARNDPPELRCGRCGGEAFCVRAGNEKINPERLLCVQCKAKESPADNDFLPLVNSPRIGMCKYNGGNTR